MFFSIAFTASRTQVATYLLCIALFSISFLVFLNSSISFVITERIGDRDNVGNAVGTLGFADELVALVACPLWGLVSDRIGVRPVAVMGFAIVGCSLFVLVQAKNVYPQLLLARLFFSLGGAATATMVTAVLPSMTAPIPETRLNGSQVNVSRSRHIITPSISSELTITPARWRSRSPQAPEVTKNQSAASTSRLAGLVGVFTGLGALIALLLFLPLPTKFQGGHSRSEAVADSFYVVGAVAFAIAIISFFGLRKLPGEESKTLRNLFRRSSDKSTESSPSANDSSPKILSYTSQFISALTLGFRDRNIGLGYLGGFVARASSVAISAFIPLFCNAYFISTGRCPASSAPPETLPPDFKENCRRAYILAATLTGSSQLVALFCAPIFGYVASRSSNRFNFPLLTASILGIAGYVSFALVRSPDPKTDEGSGAIYFVAALLGISQIGAIVCSLSLLGRGIQGETTAGHTGTANGHTDVSSEPNSNPRSRPTSSSNANGTAATNRIASTDEATPLIATGHNPIDPAPESRAHLKGSIAGMYSLLGGAGILLLTKLGGFLFDDVGRGAPFWMMAIFNALLAAGTVGVGLKGWVIKGGGE